MENGKEEGIVERDMPAAIALVKELKENADNVLASVKDLIHKVQGGLFNTEKGISLLEVKNHMMLSYLLNMTYLITRKLKGLKIEGDPAIERLVEIRTVLEKIRPIDQKMKYQIDKLIKTAATGVINENDPLRFKPNPDNMMSKLEDSEDSEEDTGKDKKKSKVYVPPRIAAMHYDGDETAETKRKAMLEKAKQRALSSTIIEELKGEYYDGPEEIRESSLHKLKDDARAKERQRYEEEYMTRINLTKKEKHAAKQMTTVSSLKGLTRFQDISALDYDEDDEFPKKKKRKVAAKKPFKKSKKKGHRKKFKK